MLSFVLPTAVGHTLAINFSLTYIHLISIFKIIYINYSIFIYIVCIPYIREANVFQIILITKRTIVLSAKEGFFMKTLLFLSTKTMRHVFAPICQKNLAVSNDSELTFL